jgi:hypothetical protein
MDFWFWMNKERNTPKAITIEAMRKIVRYAISPGTA